MWLVVYISPSLQMADAVERLLLDEGFLVRRKAVSGSDTYELRVLESEAKEARELLVEKGL